MRSLDEVNDTDQTTICNFNISQGIDPVSTHTKNTKYVLTKAKRQSPLITSRLITLCVLSLWQIQSGKSDKQFTTRKYCCNEIT